MLLTNVLFKSELEVNSTLKLSFAIPGMMMSSLLIYLSFILNLMQFSMQPSVEMMPCQIAFLFSDLVFHRSR